jgi:protein-L-isoaspartate O-methyltransferase
MMPGTMDEPDATKAPAWYESNAKPVAERHESFDPAKIHYWWHDHLPQSSAIILDIGAGTGRDAAWLASLGHNVLAVEPAYAMQAEGLTRRPNPNFRWINDQLPDLQKVRSSGTLADLILLSAVWMHIAAHDRTRAFRILI